MPDQFLCPRCGATLTKQDVCGYCGGAVSPTQSMRIKKADAEIPDDSGSVLSRSIDLAGLKRPKASQSIMSGIMMLLFAIPWVTCILFGFFFFGAKFISEYTTQSRLNNEGVTVSGVVTRLTVDDSGDSISYNVSYRFKAPLNGTFTVFENTESVSEAVFKTLKTGGIVDVIFIQSDPATSAVKVNLGFPDVKMPLIILAFELFGLAFGVVMLMVGLRMSRTFLALRSQGVITSATIYDRWVEIFSDSSSYNVAYAFKVPGFDEKLFTNAVQSYQAYKKMKIGDIVAVSYLPTNPKISTLKDFSW